MEYVELFSNFFFSRSFLEESQLLTFAFPSEVRFIFMHIILCYIPDKRTELLRMLQPFSHSAMTIILIKKGIRFNNRRIVDNLRIRILKHLDTIALSQHIASSAAEHTSASQEAIQRDQTAEKQRKK